MFLAQQLNGVGASIAARVPSADPAPGGGFLNLDPVKADLNSIIVVLILLVAGFIIFKAFKGQWGKVMGIAGIVLLGLVVAGLSTKGVTGTSALSDKFWSMFGVS